jgi:two-component system response regulator FixJ
MGFTCRAFAGGDEFLTALEGLEPGCVLLDMRMPRPNGLAVQAELSGGGSRMPVIAMTGYGDVDVAVQSMRLGALDFLEKPFSREVLADALERGFAQLRQADER